ncbi:hypothetical protein LCGC14_0557130 [marine sediment metagenome]|uniref:Bacterial type II secretion system protein E domain-containing protein n=1 Tax=marine sediment metagenome TaxID=412755 RepID=A0A0F9RN07_9ZZZZ
MNLKNVSYFQEKENWKGKKEVTLIIDCNKCIKKEEPILKSDRCLSCLLNHIYLNKERKFTSVSILPYETLIESPHLGMLLDYFKKFKKIKKITKRIKNFRKKKCKFVEFKCSLILNSRILNDTHIFVLYNPITALNRFTNLYNHIKKVNLTNSICQNCQSQIEQFIRNILDFYEDLSLIKELEHKNVNLHQFLFSWSLNLEDHQPKLPKIRADENNVLLTCYEFGEFKSYQAEIYQVFEENEKLYQTKEYFGDDRDINYFEQITMDIMQKVEIPDLKSIIPLKTLIDLYKNNSIRLIISKYNLSELNIKRVGLRIAIKKLHLSKLFPLLSDDLIEEIFLDSPYDEIYLNHRDYGRCRTNLRLNFNEIHRIKTLVRLYSGRRLDYMNPSIKLVLENKYFHCRFGLDVEPIQIHNFALDIRKLNKNIFTILDLLKTGTLNSLIAAFLYFNILRRRNITVTGETDTGKTTLINALDLLVPKGFRKIYVESVTESINQREFGKHQLKYKVDSIDNEFSNKFTKSTLIKTLLHRSPDLIYLGEILTKEEAHAMFHCLAAGLKGFQTIHANSIRSLINRFLFHFEINKSCLSDLGLLILMKKELNERRIVTIAEICDDKSLGEGLHDLIFRYDPIFKNWKTLKPLYDTKVITELRKYENFSREQFISIIKIYTEIFKLTSKIKGLSKVELNVFFNKISYFSSTSFNSLKDFWSEWKKKWNLNH